MNNTDKAVNKLNLELFRVKRTERQVQDALNSGLLTQEERDSHQSELRDLFHRRSQIVAELNRWIS
jgi:hypothetical protein